MRTTTETVKEAVKILEEGGYRSPIRHKEHEEFDLPRDMESLTDKDLGNHLGVWASLISRADFDLAKSKADELVLGNRVHWKRNVEISKGDPSEKVTVLKAKIEAREDMKELFYSLEEAQVRVRLLTALVEGYRKKFEAISREISRRESEKGVWKREDKVEKSTKKESSWKVGEY